MTNQQAAERLKELLPYWESLKDYHEIILAAYRIGHIDGYDEGFQTALAAIRGINRLDAEPPAPPNGLAASTPGAAPVEELGEWQEFICGGLKP